MNTIEQYPREPQSRERHSQKQFTAAVCALLAIISWTALVSPAKAHNKVVVVPLLGESNNARNGQSLRNVITVSKKNGDFDNIHGAMDSINDAEQGNEYLIFIGPGEYELGRTLVMKNFVDISGSGPTLTTLQGTFGSTDFTQSAMINMGAVTRISNMTIQVTASATTHAAGIYSEKNRGEIDNIIMRTHGNSPQNLGLYAVLLSGNANIKINDSNFDAFSSTGAPSADHYGIFMLGDAKVNIAGSTVSQDAAGSAIYSTSSEYSLIKYSFVKSLFSSAGTFRLDHSITGSALSGAGTHICILTATNFGSVLNNDCSN